MEFDHVGPRWAREAPPPLTGVSGGAAQHKARRQVSRYQVEDTTHKGITRGANPNKKPTRSRTASVGSPRGWLDMQRRISR